MTFGGFAAPGRHSGIGALLLFVTFACPLFAEIELQLRDGRPIVDGVYVNSHGPFRFVLDTGTNVNLIDAALAKTMDMSASFDVDLISAAGHERMPGCDGNEIQLGPAEAGGQQFLFSRLDVVHNISPDVQGVLGQWFLSRFDYLLDLRAKKLEFGKKVPAGLRTPFRMLNGRTTIATSLGDLVLDSGTPRLVLFAADASRGGSGILQTMAGSQMVGTLSSTLMIEGRHVWHGDALTISNRTEPDIAGLLPLRLFRTVYVSNSEGYVILD